MKSLEYLIFTQKITQKVINLFYNLNLVEQIWTKTHDVQDRKLISGLIQSFNELNSSKLESIDKLAELWDPYSLVHEGYFYEKSK